MSRMTQMRKQTGSELSRCAERSDPVFPIRVIRVIRGGWSVVRKALDRAVNGNKNTATFESTWFRGVVYRMRNALKGAMT